MNEKNNKVIHDEVIYGVKIVKRPHIKVSTSIDICGEKGRALIKKETEKVLIRQKNTLAKLATL